MDKRIEALVERLKLTSREIDEVYRTKAKPTCINKDGHYDWEYERVFCEAQLCKICSDPDLVEGLELLEKVRQGTTIEAIITKKRKRPNLILTDD